MNNGLGEVVVYGLGIAAMYTYFTNMTTRTMGANRSAVEAAAEGELPKVLAVGVVLFLWPEIPSAPAEWSYTDPLLAIVVVTLVAGEVILWRMSHPRKPRMQPVADHSAASGQPSISGQPSVSGQRP